jgi:hypothetical protein
MEQEHVFIGIRRDGVWHVYPAESVTEVALHGVDVLRDLRSTLVMGPAFLEALAELREQDALGQDPFYALDVPGHACRGLELVREHVRRALTLRDAR